jgi:hypothetical protein
MLHRAQLVHQKYFSISSDARLRIKRRPRRREPDQNRQQQHHRQRQDEKNQRRDPFEGRFDRQIPPVAGRGLKFGFREIQHIPPEMSATVSMKLASLSIMVSIPFSKQIHCKPMLARCGSSCRRGCGNPPAVKLPANQNPVNQKARFLHARATD